MEYQALNNWWAGQDSNLQPDRYERPALTVELPARAGLDQAHPTLGGEPVVPFSNFRHSTQREKFEADPMVVSLGLWHNAGKRALNLLRGAKQWPRQAHARNRLQRFALAWNSAIEKESLNINKLAQVLAEKSPSTVYNNLFQRGAFFAKIRCSVRRCMLRRRAVSETLRPQSS
jgi:hypothetical protein